MADNNSPERRSCPITPPPSLVTDTGTASKRSYKLKHLLSLASSPATLPPPTIKRIDSFSEIRRDSSTEWGVDESCSSILDGEPISKSLPIPTDPRPLGHGPGGLLFNYSSMNEAAPVLIDFNKDPFKGPAAPGFAGSAGARGARGSIDSTASTASMASMGMTDITLSGSTMPVMRFGARTPSISQASSPARSRSSSISSNNGMGRLNPFAPPFPLPEMTAEGRKIAHEVPSLPVPKAMPASLPARPNVVLPPVFVRRESAALPQPMSLAGVAPLGVQWEGENSLSGNDRRRRASLGVEEQVRADPRPERLVRLGQNLRKSVSAQRAS